MLTADIHKLGAVETYAIAEKTRAAFLAAAEEMMIDNDLEQALVDIYIPLAACLAEQHEKHASTRVIGINGAQGSGKSTLCKLLQIVLEKGFAKHVAVFSIDDIYMTRAERKTRAEEIHPLLKTRGVPGTHDVALGLHLLSELRLAVEGQVISLPLFNKAIDDRSPQEDFRQATGPIDLVLFEGWCVGAKAQREEALTTPVNSLERLEDPDQHWRRYVNDQLKGSYKILFKIPGMASVIEWRSKQERKLARTSGKTGREVMDTVALQRFIMHYERLTREMLAEMPDRADLVFTLNTSHQIDSAQVNTRTR